MMVSRFELFTLTDNYIDPVNALTRSPFITGLDAAGNGAINKDGWFTLIHPEKINQTGPHL